MEESSQGIHNFASPCGVSLIIIIAFNCTKCVLLTFPHGSAPPSHFISGVEDSISQL